MSTVQLTYTIREIITLMILTGIGHLQINWIDWDRPPPIHHFIIPPANTNKLYPISSHPHYSKNIKLLFSKLIVLNQIPNCIQSINFHLICYPFAFIFFKMNVPISYHPTYYTKLIVANHLLTLLLTGCNSICLRSTHSLNVCFNGL